jgi:thiopeptide-type bacteriocin biosynthesis protein
MASRATPLGLFSSCAELSQGRYETIDTVTIDVENITIFDISVNLDCAQDYNLSLVGDVLVGAQHVGCSLAVPSESVPTFRRSRLRRTREVDYIILRLRNSPGGLKLRDLIDECEVAGLDPARCLPTVQALEKAGILIRLSDAEASHLLDRNNSYARPILEIPRTEVTSRGPLDRETPPDFIVSASYRGQINPSTADKARSLAVLASSLGGYYSAEQYRRALEARFDGDTRPVPLADFLRLCEESNVNVPEEVAILRSPAAITMLRSKLAEAHRMRKSITVFDDDDIALLGSLTMDMPLPRSIEIAISLLREEKGSNIIALARYVGAPYGGASAGRFAPLLPTYYESMRGIESTNADEIVAEIRYRPSITKHSGLIPRRATTDRTIDIGLPRSTSSLDLGSMFVAIRNGRLRLFSSETNCWIVPIERHRYLTPFFGPPIARVLRAASLDGHRAITGFAWPAGSDVPFTPRVVAKNALLARASWNVHRRKLSDIDEVRAWIKELQTDWNLPDRALLVSRGDNAIPIRVDTKLGLDVIWRTFKQHKDVHLEETISEVDQGGASSSEGWHATEIIFSFSMPQKPVASSLPTIITQREARKNWRYVRWYCPPIDLDRLVVEASAIVQAAEGVNEWHVVRYSAGRTHLRFRFSASETQLGNMQREVQALTDALMASGVVSTFEWSLYEPELERYGGSDGMAAAESLFTISSVQAANALRAGRLSTELRGLRALEALAEIMLALDKLELRDWIDALPATRVALPLEYQQFVRDISRRSMVSKSRSLSAFLEAAEGSERWRSLASVAHMHFNRFGIHNAEEVSALRALRQGLLSLCQRADNSRP